MSVPGFICPSVFSATGWCRRALLPSELLLVFDVPPIVGAHFSSPGAVSDLLHDIRTPNKVLVQMARALRQSFAVGGSDSFSESVQVDSSVVTSVWSAERLRLPMFLCLL